MWREGPREEVREVAAAVGSYGAGYKQKGPGPAVWGHSGLGTEGGNKEEGGRPTAEVVRGGRPTTTQGQTQGVEEEAG